MKNRVVALGFFDGVHIGHGALLAKTREVALRLDATASVMTYSNHPSGVLGHDAVKLINTTAERCVLMRELYGIEDIIVKEFTEEYSALSCEKFFEDIILNELCACHVVAGFDFRFGSKGKGDATRLSALAGENGLGCDIIDAVSCDGETVSSSSIRVCIKNGDMERAERLLGHPHCIISEITHGRGLGNQLGFPTVNQELESNILVPRYGVYAARVWIDGKSYGGVTNIGVRPTVAERAIPRAETNIFDFSGDLYGKTIKTELISFIRDEKKFSDIESLRRQIALDAEAAKRLF